MGRPRAGEGGASLQAWAGELEDRHAERNGGVGNRLADRRARELLLLGDRDEATRQTRLLIGRFIRHWSLRRSAAWQSPPHAI